MRRGEVRPVGTRRVAVVGAGGNIGSHLVPHLARMPEVGELILIDRDRYESRNLSSQAIGSRDVGRPKAEVAAARSRAIRPAVRAIPVVRDVEALPMGRLRADLILACLDTRRARQRVNELAWRLGVPWIDAGVLADGLLARVDVFVPGPRSPCLECGWSDRDYEALEQSYPCAPGAVGAPTDAPSGLGALAAALQAIECGKRLSAGVALGGSRLSAGAENDGARDDGVQLVLDASAHRYYRTARRKNPECRLGSHDVWEIEELGRRPAEVSLADLFENARDDRRASDAAHREGLGLRVEGQRFARELACPGCGLRRTLLNLAARLEPAERVCPRCGAALRAVGFALSERLEWAELGPEERHRSLESLGIEAGDVVSIGPTGREIHLEIYPETHADAHSEAEREAS